MQVEEIEIVWESLCVKQCVCVWENGYYENLIIYKSEHFGCWICSEFKFGGDNYGGFTIYKKTSSERAGVCLCVA